MKKIILTGGGTGGHVYPCLALLPQLKRNGYTPVYFGGEGDTIEKRLAIQNELRYESVPTVKLNRSFNVRSIRNNFTIPFALSNGVKIATQKLKAQKPDVVFSKGGFVALPVVIAARRIGIPVVCHESDLTLGLSNKIAKRLGARVLCANPHSTFGEYVGMPLREELFEKSQNVAKDILHIRTEKNVLLVVGGSSGAERLNNLISANVDSLTEKFFVLHIYGNQNYVPPRHVDYLAYPYANDISVAYAAADIVLSRAGATALYEISALNKRAVFLPLPKGVSRGDQILNADLAVEYGGYSINESEAQEKLLPTLNVAIQNLPMRSIACDTNGKIVRIIDDSIRRGEKCKNKKP